MNLFLHFYLVCAKSSLKFPTIYIANLVCDCCPSLITGKRILMHHSSRLLQWLHTMYTFSEQFRFHKADGINCIYPSFPPILEKLLQRQTKQMWEMELATGLIQSMRLRGFSKTLKLNNSMKNSISLLWQWLDPNPYTPVAKLERTHTHTLLVWSKCELQTPLIYRQFIPHL